MKENVILMVLLFTALSLYGMTIPYSPAELKTEGNHISDFVRIVPDDSMAIPLQTDAWLWHDSENLFLLQESEVDENFEAGRLAAPDEWVECDFFRIQIITDIKNYYAYMFYSFPQENHYDGIRKTDMNIDTGWNSNYRSESEITGNVWKSTMIIPFRDLRFYGKEPHNWKIILTRYFQKNEEYYSYPYGNTDQGKDYFRNASDVTINEPVSGNKNYRITPWFIKKYDLMTETESFDPDNIGLDFSYNPTSATKMKISLNPDFSDVPMDSEEDNFNVRYAPWFGENRYFFIEDLDVFGVGDNLFYTRHIMQPRYAIKLTGNAEHFSYGFLSAMDKKTMEGDDILNDDDVFNLLAFKPKWEDLSIQLTLLNRMNKDYHNEVLLLNPQWEFVNNHNLWSELDLSYKKSDTEPEKKGYAVYCGYNGRKDDFNWSLSASKISRDYTTDMGRLFQTDLSSISADISLNCELESKIIKTYGMSVWGGGYFDNTIDLMCDQNFGGNFWATSPQDINCVINGNIGQERYLGKLYDWDYIYVNLGYWNIDWLSTRVSYSVENRLVYNLNMTFKNDLITLGFWGKVTNHLTYSICAQRKRYFEFPVDCQMDDQYWIINSDLIYNFSNSVSLTNGLRYNDYETGDQTAYIGFFSNLRFEFKENCNLYIGYKTAQDEIDQNYIPAYKQAYVKVSYTL